MIRTLSLLLLLLTSPSCDTAPAEDAYSTARSASQTQPSAKDLVYEARTGEWVEWHGGPLAGNDLLRGDRLLRATPEGLLDRGAAGLEDLELAHAAYQSDRPSRDPELDDWVLVLGDGPEAGHRKLREVVVGSTFAFGGRLYATRKDGEWGLAIRDTGRVLARVLGASERPATEVIEARLRASDGTTTVLRATPEHPVYLPRHGGYVAIGDLGPGERLLSTDGGETEVLATRAAATDELVYNLDVAEVNNYYAGGASEDDGVLVHNARCRCPTIDLTGHARDRESDRNFSDWAIRSIVWNGTCVPSPNPRYRGTWNCFDAIGTMVVVHADPNRVQVCRVITVVGANDDDDFGDY